MSESEDRYKVLYIDEDVMVTAMVVLTDDTGQWVRLPVFKGLPKGFSVKSVHYEYSRRAFAVVISHKSFPIVPHYELLLAVGAEMETQTFDIDLIRAWAKEHPNMAKLSASMEEFCVGKIGKEHPDEQT